MHGVIDGLLQRDRDPLVIDNLDPSLIFFSNGHSRKARAAQSAGHGDAYDLVVFFKKLLPKFHHASR